MDADIIVIGAGIGGLSAAIRLAACGRKVIMLERNPRVGGKMAELSEAGFRWDTGPSLITMRPVLEELFSVGGQRMENYLELLPVDPLTRYFFSDGSRLDISRDLALTLQQIKTMNGQDVKGYLSYLAYASRLDRLTSPVFTFGPPPSMKSVSLIRPMDIPWVGAETIKSLEATIKRHIQSEHLRQLLMRFATYVGSDPYQVSAVLSVIAHVELSEGVWYPRGGIFSIAAALQQLAENLGVVIHTGVEISKISYEDAVGVGCKARGVVMKDGQELKAPLIISNLDVTRTYETLLPRDVRFNRTLRRLTRLEPSCSGFILLLGVSAIYGQLAHHNIFFSQDYRKEFQQIFRDGLPPDDPTIYVSITSKADAGHAPSDCENWFVLVNAPAVDSRYDWDVHKEEYTNLVLQRLAEKGFDIRGKLKVQHAITPQELDRMNGSRRGALYGTSFNDRLAPFKRPGNRCPDMQGLYFVGGTTHPGGGVPLAMLSGKVVADMIQGQEQ